MTVSVSRKIRFQVERILFSLLLFLVQLLPRPTVLACGRALGRLAHRLDARHRKVALANIAGAFPDASPAEVNKLVRQCFEHFGEYTLDMLYLFNKGVADAGIEEFEFEGLEHVEAAYARGKGVILFSGHFGAWEMMAVAHGWKGYPMGVVVRKLDNPYLEELLYRFRTLTGNWVIEKTEAFRPMLKALRAGKGVAIMIDQNARSKNRVFVDFFGRLASTTPALALLKLKTDAALIPVVALPIPGNKYRLTYLPEVKISETGDRDQDVLLYTQACTAVLEAQIRRNPRYWLWLHRRWKKRPKGEAAGKVKARKKPRH